MKLPKWFTDGFGGTFFRWQALIENRAYPCDLMYTALTDMVVGTEHQKTHKFWKPSNSNKERGDLWWPS